MSAGIQILNSTSIAPEDFDHISRTLSIVFRLPVRIVRGALDTPRAYDGSRRQYHSTVLLAQMLLDGGPWKKITVVDIDLFVPVLTFVFGEAQLDGTAAIVSTHRLSNRFYGMEEDRILLRERLEKEIVHELGHTFGLIHCRQFECVMRSSTYVEEIDLKRAEPCAGCSVLLDQKIRSFNAACSTPAR